MSTLVFVMDVPPEFCKYRMTIISSSLMVSPINSLVRLKHFMPSREDSSPRILDCTNTHLAGRGFFRLSDDVRFRGATAVDDREDTAAVFGVASLAPVMRLIK